MTTSVETSRSTPRAWVRHVTIVVASLAILCSAACRSDGGATEPVGGGASGPTADEEFSLEVADKFVAVTRAGHDLCQLKFAVPEEPLEAANSAQLTQSVSLRVAWLRAVADALPTGFESNAQILREAATALMDGAETAGFPTEFWSGPVAAETIDSEPYRAAMMQYSALVAAQCPEDESIVIPSG